MEVLAVCLVIAWFVRAAAEDGIAAVRSTESPRITRQRARLEMARTAGVPTIGQAAAARIAIVIAPSPVGPRRHPALEYARTRWEDAWDELLESHHAEMRRRAQERRDRQAREAERRIREKERSEQPYDDTVDAEIVDPPQCPTCHRAEVDTDGDQCPACRWGAPGRTPPPEPEPEPAPRPAPRADHDPQPDPITVTHDSNRYKLPLGPPGGPCGLGCERLRPTDRCVRCNPGLEPQPDPEPESTPWRWRCGCGADVPSGSRCPNGPHDPDEDANGARPDELCVTPECGRAAESPDGRCYECDHGVRWMCPQCSVSRQRAYSADRLCSRCARDNAAGGPPFTCPQCQANPVAHAEYLCGPCVADPGRRPETPEPTPGPASTTQPSTDSGPAAHQEGTPDMSQTVIDGDVHDPFGAHTHAIACATWVTDIGEHAEVCANNLAAMGVGAVAVGEIRGMQDDAATFLAAAEGAAGVFRQHQASANAIAENDDLQHTADDTYLDRSRGA